MDAFELGKLYDKMAAQLAQGGLNTQEIQQLRQVDTELVLTIGNLLDGRTV